MMMKKLLCLAAVLALVFVFPAAAEQAAEPVTAAELDALRESVLAQALTSEPLNDPSAESAQSEDGTYFQYEAARIYAAGTELAADSPVSVLVFEDSEGPVFRGTGIDTFAEDLFAAYPLENADLAGTREEAVLYLRETADGGYVYGRIPRDGQRISAAEYGEMLPAGESFRWVSVTYTLTAGLVSSIRADGLDSAVLVDASRAEELLAELKEIRSRDEYRAVRSSRNGLELTPFGEEDLVFSGFSYTELQPDTLPGSPEREMIDNEDGTWLMRCDGNGFEAVFRCDAEGGNAVVLSFSITDEETEGPRCVRLGDSFSDDFCRFRSGENEMEENMTELLYGTADAAPRGLACYDPDDMSLRYTTAAPDGTQVELVLRYVQNVLTEILLQTV